MANKYENMNMIDLLNDVKAHGVPTDADGVVAIQDLLARLGTEKIVDAANNNSWRDMVYFILFHVWHWEVAVSFFNEHSNLNYISYKNDSLKLKKVSKELEEANDANAVYRNQVDEFAQKNLEKDVEIGKMKQEIIELKAKLYDMMIAEGK